MSGLPDASALAADLAALHGTRRVRIALSGGLDSRVLLHLAIAASRQGGWPMDALHVDHGLQEGSAAWAAFCGELCEQAGIALQVHRAKLEPTAGQSLEAVARAARYAFFRQELQTGDVLLLAQHADDQAETVLLQLLRGAGPRGLAAMPAVASLGQGQMLRPLLGVSREDLQAYAEEAGLSWVDDPSNADRRFDRNYLRHEIMPALKARFPATLQTLSRSAGHCAEAAQLLDELASMDFKAASVSGGLDWLRVQQLSTPRQRNLLRYFFREKGLLCPDARQLSGVLHDFSRAATSAQPKFVSQDACLSLSGGVLRLDELRAPVPDFSYDWLDWRQPLVVSELDMVLRVESLAEAGIRLPEAAALRVCKRRGGEKIRVHAGQGRRRLKSLLQEAGIAPESRDRFPLIWHADELIAVPGVAVDPRYRLDQS